MKKLLTLSSLSLFALSVNAEMTVINGNASDYDESVFTVNIPDGTAASDFGKYGWKVEANKTFTVDKDVTLYKHFEQENLEIKPEAILYSYGTIQVNDNMSLTVSTNATRANSGPYISFKNLTLGSNSSYSDIVNGNISVLSSGGLLTMNSSSKFTAYRFRLQESSTANISGDFWVSNIDTRASAGATPIINMNKAFSIRNTNGSFGANIYMMNTNTNGTLRLNVNASQRLGNLSFLDNTSAEKDTLTISFANGAVLSFKNIITQSSSNIFQKDADLILEDFTNNSLFFEGNSIVGKLVDYNGGQAFELRTIKDKTTDEYVGHIILSGTDSNKKALSDFSLVEGTTLDVNGKTVSGWWLNAGSISNIPEPAEWAAIFGALALGLAMYRKRK